MTRRQLLSLLSGLMVTPLLALAPVPDVSARRHAAWRVRVIIPAGAPFHRGRVVDAATGRDVSMHFPLLSADQLKRSLQSGLPVQLTLYRLNLAGHFVLNGDRIAMRVAWVHVLP